MSGAEIKKQKWMDDFGVRSVAAGVYFPGQVDWDTAEFLFRQGLFAADAVARVAEYSGKRRTA